MAEFTPTQGRYLSYIHTYTAGFGLPPAEAEIAEAIGVSPPSVNQMMKTLERKGLIQREPGVPRSIQILVDETTIPRWTGDRITRTITEWVMAKPSAKKFVQSSLAQPAGKQPKEVYVLKITLSGSKPPIWRRIETGNVPLAKLHAQIQAAMGWTNSHMHQFVIGNDCYMDPQRLDKGMNDWASDYSGVTIAELVDQHGPKMKMRYEYDFGDGWRHIVALEKIIEPQANTTYPRCTAGKCACPPEDIGGIYGYYSYLDAIANPDHPEHEDYLESNGPMDPMEFDEDEATRAMQTGLPAW